MTALGRILVTGASGFIGRRLTLRLAAESSAEITLLGRSAFMTHRSGAAVLTTAGTDQASLRAALEGRHFDAVIHLAAAGVAPGERDPAVLVAANAFFPANLLLALADAPPRAFIMLGTCSEYAPSDPVAGGLAEDAPVETKRLYGATKAAGTITASTTAASLGIAFAGLRSFNVYGPGETSHRLLPSLLRGFASGETIALSAGTQVRDFMSVDDTVEGLVRMTDLMLRDPKAGGIYNLCSGRGVTVGDFARVCAELAGAPIKQLDFGAIPLRPDDMMWQVGDNARLRKALGWAPSSDLRAGLVSAIAEMRGPDAR